MKIATLELTDKEKKEIEERNERHARYWNAIHKASMLPKEFFDGE